uniref:hypothetical protein n=1 Tax=uncultured Draconibacterium sp. TaxID=1573823 RepID=UPI003217ECC2
MLNDEQTRILEELYKYADPREVAETVVDMLESWCTNPDNKTADTCEQGEKFFIARKLAAFFRQANSSHHAGKKKHVA